LRAPDFGFAEIAWQWAGGASLDEVLMKADMPAGDFVRSIKQVIDLAAQVADAAGDSPIRGTARRAVDAMRRGILLQELPPIGVLARRGTDAKPQASPPPSKTA